MSTLVQARCTRHPTREAAARCVSCRGMFCRECATEHNNRILCADCLGREEKAEARSLNRLASAGRMVALFLCFCICWYLFHSLGSVLLSIPPKYHDGSLWQNLMVN